MKPKSGKRALSFFPRVPLAAGGPALLLGATFEVADALTAGASVGVVRGEQLEASVASPAKAKAILP
jgi:hypothetical protein